VGVESRKEVGDVSDYMSIAILSPYYYVYKTNDG